MSECNKCPSCNGPPWQLLARLFHIRHTGANATTIDSPLLKARAMKKHLLTLAIAMAPLLVAASDVRIDIGGVRVQAPGISITFGSVDNRGYYWDGYEYRDPGYWRKHNGPKGAKYYTGRGNNGVPHQGGGHCPPGQAKKGNC